ncbi:MAG: hypothetical protein GY941_09050 [Planctomycetes bacterium]|nr:hypothetical protein [Planctomycetota bacterium]
MLKILTIPFDEDSSTFCDEILNDFCLNKHLKSYSVEFFVCRDKPYWTLFLDYTEIIEKRVPGKKAENLTKPEEAFFEKLREWRMEKARSGGVPVYIIATNSELTQIVKVKPKNIETLRTIKGFGKKKIDKFGKEVLKLVKVFFEE